MLRVLRQRNFGLLWFGQLISLIGDWLLFLALPFYIYDLTGSAFATSAMFIVEVLPRLLVGSLAGVFVDRWDRKKTMIVADLSRAVVLLPIIWVRSADWIWVIYVVAFAQSVISQFFNPAKSAVIPNLVSSDDLLAANSLNAMSDSLTRLVGPALGGAMMAVLGLVSVVSADIVSFLISALMLVLITLPKSSGELKPAEHAQAGSAWMQVWRDWAAGMKLVKQERLLFALFLVFGVMSLGDSMITALIVPFVKQIMRGDAMQFGWVMTAQGTGALIGGLAIGQFGRHWPRTRLIGSALLVIGVLSAITFNLPYFWVAIVMLLLIGLCVPAAFVTGETLLQSGTRDEFRGRVFGTLGTTLALASLIGMGVAGLESDRLGTVAVLNFASALYFASGLLAFVILQQPARQLVNTEPGTVTAE